ncbi:MAG: DNA circularization N-terminal domain-containing protein [Collimonas sp.]|uniref:DNA circularization N-terminal domain-containing protein n=1 Tax=Collimonas sp. TaxID=1963772 RepID=UPI003265497E
MSLDNFLGSVTEIQRDVNQGIGAISRLGQDLGLGGLGGVGGSWSSQLRPASYRGLPFAVLGSEGHFGRRNVVHTYPYKDTVWVEDLGRAARRINMTGFLVEDSLVYGGGSVIAQRERFIRECESSDGGGELLHPTLGQMTVSLAGPLVVTERWDKGRYFELGFSFIESGERSFPGVETSTVDAVNQAADAADAAANADFVTRAGAVLKQGAVVVQQAVNTAAAWAGRVQKLSNDATNLYNMVGTLKGNFGRFFGGRNNGGLGGVASSAGATSQSVSGLISLGAKARSNVSSAITTLSSVASGLGL